MSAFIRKVLLGLLFVIFAVVFYLLINEFKMPERISDGYHAVFHKNSFSIDGYAECSEPLVPNTVHWIWFHKSGSFFRFHHYISSLSVIRILKPGKIILWYNMEPIGKWWDLLQTEIVNKTNIEYKLIHKTPPIEIYGNKIEKPEHQADIVKMQVLLEHGGIYLDFDVVVLKSFEPLRCHSVTLGQETHNGLCAGVILSEPNAKFLYLWLESYRTFDDTNWDKHAVKIPYRLWRRNPWLLHVESESLHRPNWKEEELPYIYSAGLYHDWKKKNYAIHLWYRFHNIDYDPDSIKNMDNTLGQIFRFVYYGSPNLRQ